jgi:hypothetical protein
LALNRLADLGSMIAQLVRFIHWAQAIAKKAAGRR